MYTRIQIVFFISIFSFISICFPSYAELGTAAHYSPSYLPATTCLGNDPRQFPANNLFATAGDGIWDSGACCGRQYLVRCISSITPGGAACSVKNQTILITIVDHAPDATMSTTMVLSEHAFRVIANAQADSIKIQYQQYSPNTVPNAVLTTSPVKVSGGRGISRKWLIQADASISAPGSGY